MADKKRVGVFIDGSNFYHKIKDKKIDLKNTKRFDFTGLVSWLARERKVVYKGYYVGIVRAKQNDARAQRLRRSQQQLFSHLQSEKQQFEIKKGFMMKSDGAFHEKGVDVHMATDLLVGAYENLWDTAIIISSDTDLIPTIEKVKSLGKNISVLPISQVSVYNDMRHYQDY
jgi:uncharacterized LabA/DUF88 family protein